MSLFFFWRNWFWAIRILKFWSLLRFSRFRRLFEVFQRVMSHKLWRLFKLFLFSCQPPQPERVYLISPPSSPPMHWQQMRETKPKPGIEMEILSKLAELKPGDTVELIPPQPKFRAPQINVHVCDESKLNSNRDVPKISKGKILQTRRPPIRW